jgi:hypothetical protein
MPNANQILFTPLTRRMFSSSTGVVADNLKDQRVETIAAAKVAGVTYIDLNAASQAYVNKIGSTAAHKYGLKKDDSTPLNQQGGVVFGRVVADLLLGHSPTIPSSAAEGEDSAGCFASWFIVNPTISTAI